MKSLIPWRQKENNAVAPWNDDWFDRNGVLTVTLPKTESAKKTVQIKVN
ncbi:MAG: hypothetical protein PHC61_05655 [Chitinivibrionales bacterium]|nr:hypothetical protein [Chitinivibrionales bacterium]